VSRRQSPSRTRVRNPPCKRASYWGRGGAGVMFTCEEDGTVLLLLRAEWVEQGGTWGIPGGGIGEGHYNTPMRPITDMRVFRAKAEEEVREECGSLPPDRRTRRPMTSLPEGLAFTEYDDCGFRYVTFLCDLTREQKAAWRPYSADGENDAFVWFPLREVKAGRPLPDEYGDEHDIHFGVSFTMANLPARAMRSNPRRRNSRILRTEEGEWSDFDWSTGEGFVPTPAPATPAFRRWFLGSKVVDEQGQPLVVYHGTLGQFSGFDLSKAGARTVGGAWAGPAAYFSSSLRIARGYADARGGEVLPVWLSLKNPYEVDADGASWRSVFPEVVDVARLRGHDGVIVRNVRDPARYWDDDVVATTYVAFDPHQVKSATRNEGTFDPADPSIYRNPRPTTAERTDPALWEAVKREVTAGTKGGVRGEWSARKAQLAVALYKKRGGGYLGPKSPQNALTKWTREDWRTRSGEPSLVTGERYLPARAIEALTPAEYAATSRVKRAGLLRDEQFTRQPERIAAKTARYRRK